MTGGMQTGPDDRIEKFDNHTRHLLGAIRLCASHEYTIPAMMLTFAGVDGMAWLFRDHNGPNTGEDFKKWMDRFVLRHPPGDTSTDSACTRLVSFQALSICRRTNRAS